MLRNLNNELRKIGLSIFRPFLIDWIGFAIDNVIFFPKKSQFSHITPSPPPKKKTIQLSKGNEKIQEILPVEMDTKYALVISQ